MLGSAGCWAAYGTLLAREYQDPALFAACHRLTVDAYALQHPGDPHDRRAARSVWLHFRLLEAVFEREATLADATRLLRTLADRPSPVIAGRPACWTVTLADVASVPLHDHPVEMRRWAHAAYQAWRPFIPA